MSNTQLKTTLEINYDPAIEGAQKTEKTLGDLRGEIKALKDSLDKTAIESDEFKDKLNSLNAKQKELKEVTTLNVSESANLRKQFKQLKDDLLGLEEGTEEYNLKLKEAAEISQRLQDVNEFVKASASDLGDHIENLTGTLAGLTGGIQIVQGTMQALGVESEVVEEAIAKLQGLMAITEGLKAIEGAIDPFKRLTTAIKLATAGMSGFKKALIGTGIAGVVVLLGTLIAHWDDVTEALGFANTKQAEANRLLKEQETAINDVEDALSKRLKRMEREDASSLEMMTETLSTYQGELQKLEDEKLRMEQQAAGQGGLRKSQREYYDKLIENIGVYKEKIEDTEWEISQIREKIREEEEAEAEEARQERIAAQKKALQKEIELFELGIEEKKILYGEEWTATYEYVEMMKTLFDKKKKLYTDDEVALKQVMNEEMKFLKESTQKQRQEAMKGSTPLVGSTQGVTVAKATPELMTRVEADKVIEQNYTKWLKEENQRRLEDRKEQLEDFKQYGVDTVLNTMGSIAGILDIVSQSIDTSTEEGFKRSKQMRIATAVIDMLGGILSAWMSAMSLPFPYNFVQAGINTATATAFGSVQIDQIKRQQFGGSSNLNSSVPTIAPQMVQSGMNSNSSPLSYLRLNELANQTTKLPDTRVYVLESDISRTQKNVSVIESESMY